MLFIEVILMVRLLEVDTIYILLMGVLEIQAVVQIKILIILEILIFSEVLLLQIFKLVTMKFIK